MNDTVDRSKYIGGGDAAKVMGKHRFSSVQKTYSKIRPDIEYESEDLSDNPDVQRGIECEPKALRQIEESFPSLNGDDVYEAFDAGGGHDGQIFLRHPEANFVGGHPDGISIDPFDDRVVVHEVKAPRSGGISRIQKRGIPSRYFFQVQHYMGIVSEQTDSEVEGKVWLWDCDKWGVREIDVEFRPDIFSEMMDRYRTLFAFAKEQIPLDEIEFADTADERETYQSEKMDERLEDYYKIRSAWKKREEEMKSLKQEILSQLSGETRIEGSGYYATVKEYKSSTHLTVRKKS